MAQFNLAIIKDTSGQLQVKDFETIKGELTTLIETEFQVPNVVDTNNYPMVKEQRAKLNKVAKLINRQKINVRKQMLEMAELAETQLKELTKIAASRSKQIDKKVDTYETTLQDNRIKRANAIYGELQHLNTRGCPFETLVKVVGSKWINATCSEKQISDDIVNYYKVLDSEERFTILFEINTTKSQLELLQDFINQNGIELISAKKGE